MTPRDSRGQALGPGQVVYGMLPGPGGLALTKLGDLGDGRHRGLFQAPQQTGVLRLRFVVNNALGSVQLAPGAVLESAQAASGAATGYFEENPQVDFAASPSQLKLRFTPRDAAGLRLGVVGTMNLTMTPVVGGAAVLERVDLRRAHASGDFDFVVERDPTKPPHSASGTVTFWLDGVPLLSHPYSF